MRWGEQVKKALRICQLNWCCLCRLHAKIINIHPAWGENEKKPKWQECCRSLESLTEAFISLTVKPANEAGKNERSSNRKCRVSVLSSGGSSSSHSVLTAQTGREDPSKGYAPSPPDFLCHPGVPGGGEKERVSEERRQEDPSITGGKQRDAEAPAGGTRQTIRTGWPLGPTMPTGPRAPSRPWGGKEGQDTGWLRRHWLRRHWVAMPRNIFHVKRTHGVWTVGHGAAGWVRQSPTEVPFICYSPSGHGVLLVPVSLLDQCPPKGPRTDTTFIKTREATLFLIWIIQDIILNPFFFFFF